jgi:hypothetical protein
MARAKQLNDLTILNIDKIDTGTTSFLKKLGFDVFVEQYEMVLEF